MEESDGSMKRKNIFEIPKSGKRSLEFKSVQLPKKNINPHKEPVLFKNIIADKFDGIYADRMVLAWKLQRLVKRGILSQQISSRFVGWVSQACGKNDARSTVITFLPAIRNPITEYSTVLECIIQSQKLAVSSNMRYTHITTDAGAAAKFYHVVWNNPLEFKNVIIHLGDFHAMVETFGIIGKIVAGSGFEDIVYQAGLCTSGGIKGEK